MTEQLRAYRGYDKQALAEAFGRVDARQYLAALVRAARMALDETEGTPAHATLVEALKPYRDIP